ncbi:hypothetical protein M5D96_013180 [Drosophila gunungcola]|uniref:Uncharacterized protein n=1 Tax=Drosophila gunungcola TaxID=103775 RepID=A0A9P9YC82_9MUSC|nr:hypothetical protein M5D96_013180 [Drosophila gunungcola]
MLWLLLCLRVRFALNTLRFTEKIWSSEKKKVLTARFGHESMSRPTSLPICIII